MTITKHKLFLTITLDVVVDDTGGHNPMVIVPTETTMEILRRIADEVGFADRHGSGVQATAMTFAGDAEPPQFISRAFNMIYMVSNISGERKP